MIITPCRFLMVLRDGPLYGKPGRERPSLTGACRGVNMTRGIPWRGEEKVGQSKDSGCLRMEVDVAKRGSIRH